MTVNDMKNILAKKLKEETAYFGKSHISMRKQKDGYKIVVKGYEHIYFKMTLEHDDYFGYMVWIFDSFDNCDVVCQTDLFDEDKAVENALIDLGYHIGNCF